jgi:hypothetical protein
VCTVKLISRHWTKNDQPSGGGYRELQLVEELQEGHKVNCRENKLLTLQINFIRIDIFMCQITNYFSFYNCDNRPLL